jgi:hypothetical protein
MKRWSWSNVIAYVVVFAVIIAAISGLFGNVSSASSYVKDNYPLVDAQGKGKGDAKVYLAENKDVPTVAKELAKQQKPKEISKESPDQMFLIYSDNIVNIQKDPQNAGNTLVEIDSIQYAKENYDSSFLQGFFTAAVLQTLFDSAASSGKQATQSYRGYTSNTGSDTKSSTSSSSVNKDQPATTDRSGSFSSKSNSGTGKTDSGSTNSSVDDNKSSGTTGTFRTNNSSSSSSGSSSSSKSSSSSASRKNDGSTPSYKAPSKPSTSKKSGSFSTKKR